ncbi:hypothetical protein NDU88_000387 [Pleurodeles waltl]|uniref:Uncharacterized protein n=1 Tax=Pleurodeles waltl TaxID=8319 RepID=A0AAV7U5A8_PLEWA|nr:hypothetical protein NDU88_000387 [Pleurodeles waltl]
MSAPTSRSLCLPDPRDLPAAVSRAVTSRTQGDPQHAIAGRSGAQVTTMVGPTSLRPQVRAAGPPGIRSSQGHEPGGPGVTTWLPAPRRDFPPLLADVASGLGTHPNADRSAAHCLLSAPRRLQELLWAAINLRPGLWKQAGRPAERTRKGPSSIWPHRMAVLRSTQRPPSWQIVPSSSLPGARSHRSSNRSLSGL